MKKILGYVRNVLFLIVSGLILNIITWLIIAIQIKPTAEVLPLHYNVFFGADLTGKGYYLYLIPLVGLIILVINFVFYKYTLRREPFAAKALVAVSLVAQILILIAVLFLKSIIVI